MKEVCMAGKKDADKGKKTWFAKGKEGAERSKQVDAETQAKFEQSGIRRLWLENDTSAKFTFLDNPEFFMHEHNLKIGKSYHNYFTCIKDFDTCPLCESGDNPSYVVVGTIINHAKWKDKDEVEHTNQKQLAVFRGRARQKILKQIEKREGDLTYCVYEASRGSISTECSTGEDFEFLKRLTKAQVKMLVPEGEKEEWIEPYNYEELFKPKPIAELRKLAGTAAPIGAAEEQDKAVEAPTEEKGAGTKVGSIDDLL
jgi:hypothetical protein